jgi:hypothetical protein
LTERPASVPVIRADADVPSTTGLGLQNTAHPNQVGKVYSENGKEGHYWLLYRKKGSKAAENQYSRVSCERSRKCQQLQPNNASLNRPREVRRCTLKVISDDRNGRFIVAFVLDGKTQRPSRPPSTKSRIKDSRKAFATCEGESPEAARFSLQFTDENNRRVDHNDRLRKQEKFQFVNANRGQLIKHW